jgi:hypothetical protein
LRRGFAVVSAIETRWVNQTMAVLNVKKVMWHFLPRA